MLAGREYQTAEISPKSEPLRDSYLDFKKGVCSLDWAMAFALNVSSPKKQICTSRLNKYVCCYLFTIFISMVLPLLWILKIRLIEHISFIPFSMGS